MKGTQERPQGKSHEKGEERFLSIETVFKTIELTAESDESWEAAAQRCVREASQTIKNIREVKVESMKALVDADQIVRYRVRCRVAFAVDSHMREH
jgi:flavin-binding protein dodecin